MKLGKPGGNSEGYGHWGPLGGIERSGEAPASRRAPPPDGRLTKKHARGRLFLPAASFVPQTGETRRGLAPQRAERSRHHCQDEFETNNDAPHFDSFPWCLRPCDRSRWPCARPADRARRNKRARPGPTQRARQEQAAQGGKEGAPTRAEGSASRTAGESHGAADRPERFPSWDTASQERHRSTRQGCSDPEGAAGAASKGHGAADRPERFSSRTAAGQERRRTAR
jgi:hypothetical protein